MKVYFRRLLYAVRAHFVATTTHFLSAVRHSRVMLFPQKAFKTERSGLTSTIKHILAIACRSVCGYPVFWIKICIGRFYLISLPTNFMDY